MSEDNDGACVVLIPEYTNLPDTVDGGHHITLAYFGDTTLPLHLQQQLLGAASRVVRQYPNPIEAVTDNVELFGEDGDAVVLTLDDDPDSEIPMIRDFLISNLTPPLKEIFDEAQTFPDYRPHITLGYISDGFQEDDFEIPAYIGIRAIAVWNGEDRLEIPLALPELMHEGVLRKSGRYPWGSGKNPNQRNKMFLNYVDELKAKGLTDVEIARGLGLKANGKEFNTSDLRALKTIAKNEQKAAAISQAERLSAKGLSNIAIGQQMGINESSVRDLLKPGAKEKNARLVSTANMLKAEVEEKKYLDFGKGTENYLGISPTQLSTAVKMLQEEGYKVHYVDTPQVGNGKDTSTKVLTKKDVPWKEVNAAAKNGEVHSVSHRLNEDAAEWIDQRKPPKQVDLKRVSVNWAEDGGEAKDGLIELRRGVDDLSLGKARYAQVRIAVGGTHYLKGMAIYADDLPDGVDIRFNTNKSRNADIRKALKEQEKDPLNPFGSSIRNQKGALNIVNEEGNWYDWSHGFSSQFLSKQKPELIKEQLDLSFNIKKAEFDEINSLNNPAIKKKLLQTFADGADSSAVSLKAAGLPRTRNHVIIPITNMKDTEVYAPRYKNGEKVVLLRHPHGGIFELPELTVNNNQRTAKGIISDAIDAIGISPRVASQLSGADFDGDTVLVIPNDKRKVQTRRAIEELRNFNPREAYPKYEGMKPMSPKDKQQKMGDASNLITDMTIKGASEAEIIRAVKYSMVVIDAEKHKLNHKQARADMGIAQLKETYQGGAKAGASTIISKASSTLRVAEYKDRPAGEGGKIDPATGKKMTVLTREEYVDKKTGKLTPRTTKSTAMAETDDAYTLSSGTVRESVYADYANRMKGLGNAARKTDYETPGQKYDKEAFKKYAPEVKVLKAKLDLALQQKPVERQAQRLANTIIQAKKDANPDMDKDELKKVKVRALDEARLRMGAEKNRVKILDKEWEAIQAGAITNNMLVQILNNTDLDELKARATPRERTVMVPAKLARAKSMAASGYTPSDIAEALGVSMSTLTDALMEG